MNTETGFSQQTPSDGIVRYAAGEVVRFRKSKEQWGEFSNMASGFPLEVNGRMLRTSEALYQACKFTHLPEAQVLLIAQRSPILLARIARAKARAPRPDWDAVKVDVMRWVLRVKLVQNWERFGSVLLETGDLDIVEDSHRDTFWGAVPDEEGEHLTGRNQLGRLLMELRQQLRENSDALRTAPPPAVPDFFLLGEPVREVSPGAVLQISEAMRAGAGLPSAGGEDPAAGVAFHVKPPLRVSGGGLTPADVEAAQMIYCGSAVRLQTVSRPLAARLVMDEPYMVISIDSPGKDVPPLADSPLRVGVLRVLFNDIRRPKDGRTLFTRLQAREILDFVDAHLPQARAILVHCTGGLFRSPAVGAALSSILQGEERFFKAFHNRNPHVYETMMSVWRSDPRPAPRAACAEVPAGARMVTVGEAAITSFLRPHAFLSNFSKAPVVLDGVEYPTVEHAFQAAKTLDGMWREKIRHKENPKWARETGRSKSFPVREGWEAMREEVMLGLLRQKFSDPVRAQQLLSTGRRRLVEGNLWGDRYWGMCRDDAGEWAGENRLGELLMEVRQELAEHDDLHDQ